MKKKPISKYFFLKAFFTIHHPFCGGIVRKRISSEKIASLKTALPNSEFLIAIN